MIVAVHKNEMDGKVLYAVKVLLERDRGSELAVIMDALSRHMRPI